MYIGFSSSTRSVLTSHCLLGWTPTIGPKKTSKVLTIGLPIILIISLPIAISGIIYQVRIKKKFAEVLEDWEHDYGYHRFKYKDLYITTKMFRDRELLGRGDFGKVYIGVLPSSKLEVAVKRVSHDSMHGIKEFVVEIVSIGGLRHRNLVPLLGELLLVYECMPNGSLDRFRVIRGVASGLFYLHEGWEQIVIHRDVKASNVLLDSELNGRLGDFRLARLYDHGIDPQTTHVVGTLGYLAPEPTRTGKATTRTDVYTFGAFLLEIVCSRRPIEPHSPIEDDILVDRPTTRPSMRQVVLYLDRALALLDLHSLGISATRLSFASQEGFNDFNLS
ncbi:unnamed protein product [Coffea canephora]|uniref:Protein kinase domain-containing protein n=1 Tax=Coffea canephora TaxID=49390 RepID=A0A068UZ63_COFCA|nr:unnamed protein product [Coffea canephora]